jgi:CBS domain-containing protein
MFAIYKDGSVGFRSTADNLYEIKKTQAPSSVSLKPDDDSLFQNYMNSESEKEKKTIEAVSAYKKMANLENSEIIYHVKDIMTSNPVYIDKSLNVQDAYDKLKQTQVNQIPILDDKMILGVINKKTILNLIMEDKENLEIILSRRLEDLYLSEIITTDPITDIRRVAKVMIDFKLDAVPVVDENHILVGMVSKSDIIKAVSKLPKLQLWS